MWLPYTDTVVVVQCNPVAAQQEAQPQAKAAPQYSADQKLAPLRQLAAQRGGVERVDELSATQLRDQLLAQEPLNKAWVVQVGLALYRTEVT